MKIIADTGKCVGSGQCALTAPDLFDQREEDGTVLVLNSAPGTDGQVQRARRVVRVCPSRALTLAE